MAEYCPLARKSVNEPSIYFTKEHIKRSTHTKQKHKYKEDDVKTPPLPSKSNVSIEELLQARENLKEELRNTKNSGINIDNEIDFTYIKEMKNESKQSKYAQKIHGHHHESSQNKLKNYTQESSPEITELLDSEDEEDLIRQRRKQRKKLIEKLVINHGKELLNSESVTNVGNSVSPKNNLKRKCMDEVTVENKELKKATDMFSEKDEFDIINNMSQDNDKSETQLTDDCDDSDGYFKIRVGDLVDKKRYLIKNVLGQGMFANVVQAVDKIKGNSDVAIKIARSNAMMYRNALKEIAILKEINDADPDSRHHCVKIYRYFVHKGHLCIVLESLNMDLRNVIKKYGKNHGINMKALISYSRQLLLALRLLKRIGIVHGDIKPDNIIVNEKKNVLKLCDFGSAEKVDNNEIKPYLVSRFYRAPEIILGIHYGHGIDIWSAACTIYELATGRIMFTGNSNNKMLKCFMDVKGKIPNRLIKKGKFKDQHFNYNNNFLLHKKDEVTGREKVTEIYNLNATRNIHDELKKSHKNMTPIEEKKLLQLMELLDKMLMIDPNYRPSATECLKHSFIQEELKI